MRMNALDSIAYWLVVIGGINWGLIGFFDYNLVGELFGFDSVLTNIIYALVGLSALYMIYTYFKVNRRDRARDVRE
jgi:uncharacterized membrane protein YuzA (DUF378 family)